MDFMVKIRKATIFDLDAIHNIFKAVISRGDTYPFELPLSRKTTVSYWLGPGIKTYVAEYEEQVQGMYRLIPNLPDRGAHVANASFMVEPEFQRRGIGRALGQHCLEQARKTGYLAMQFNFVVSTNKAAVILWKKLGFKIVGKLSKAFHHKELGYVDAYIMYRRFPDEA
jgi:ribosomal protein S18 acetylase RimI-like enzyme